MLITNKADLRQYYADHRIWQGIPGIEVTKKGRIFITFYSGGTREQINNYALLIKSDDGVHFDEPIAVAFKENYRCFDPCLWIDPLGRLWFIWSFAPENAVYAAICDDPDADELVWSDVKKIGNDVMMNKPIILSTGEWLFPITVWSTLLDEMNPIYATTDNDRRAFVYKSIDNGETFTKLGGVAIPNRSCDEHLLLELQDGRIARLVRTLYGIGVSYSYDFGKTWTKGEDSGLKGPNSRFHIKRLKSGRILLINHYEFNGRNNLTALLSDDDGKTWPYKLLLDERDNVSYPDAVEHEDGYIYLTYDRERGAFRHTLDTVYADAREILIAKITEHDIIEGKLVSPESKLKCVISKLGKCVDDHKNLYNEIYKFSDKELAAYLAPKNTSDIMRILFHYYQINCINMSRLNNEKLDALIKKLGNDTEHKEQIILDIISIIRSVNDFTTKELPIVDKIKDIIQKNLSSDLSLKDISDKLGISQYYMCHVFKRAANLTVLEYKNAQKISKAKDLLVNSDKSITDIALDCGFNNASYFSKLFTELETVSPSQYRAFLKK